MWENYVYNALKARYEDSRPEPAWLAITFAVIIATFFNLHAFQINLLEVIMLSHSPMSTSVFARTNLLTIIGCCLALGLVACGGAPTRDPALATEQFAADVKKALEATRAEEDYQATMQALQATQTAIAQLAGVSSQTPIAPPPATAVAMPTALVTDTPIAPPEVPATQTSVAPAPPPPPPPPTQASQGEDFETWMKNAQHPALRGYSLPPGYHPLRKTYPG